MNKEIEEAYSTIEDFISQSIYSTKEVSDALDRLYGLTLKNQEYYLFNCKENTITMTKKQFNNIEKDLIMKIQKLDKIEKIVSIGRERFKNDYMVD